MTPSDNGATKPTVRLETITPQRAEAMLGLNVHNRPIRPRHVETLAQAIKRGDWKVNGEMIRLDGQNQLIDGQHRLLAVLEADMPIETYVARGFPTSVQETIDLGRGRSLGDALKLRGVQNYLILAAAIRKVWFYEQVGVAVPSNSFRMPTLQECLETLDRHEGLHASAEAVSDRKNGIGRAGKLMDASAICALHYLMSLADAGDADAFWEQVSFGANLESTDPVYVLRERLHRENSLTGARGVAPKVKAVFVVRTWNAYVTGETIQRLVFKAGGARPDRFPRIYGCPIVPLRELVGNKVIELTEEERELIAEEEVIAA